MSPDKHVESVRAQLLQRSIAGLKKYGVTTERKDLNRVQWLRHAQQEAMDFAVYLEVLIQGEIKKYATKNQKQFCARCEQELVGDEINYPALASALCFKCADVHLFS